MLEIFSPDRQQNHATLAQAIHTHLSKMGNSQLQEKIDPEDNRLEIVTTISGVTFINDSKATTVNATWYALSILQPEIVLIMGGVDKNNDYRSLQPLVQEKVATIICLGKDVSKIYGAFEDCVNTIVTANTMDQAVCYAFHFAQKDQAQTVLLSPACPSFDLFKNHQDRADQYKAGIKEL